MSVRFAALLFAVGLSAAKADEPNCGQLLRLSVDPVARTGDVAATLARRLAARGDAAQVHTDGGLSVVLLPGVSESLLTQPAKIEFRLVAKAPDAPGAVALPRLDGAGSESVEPQVIVNESRMRDFKVVDEPGGGAAITFRFEPTAVKNLLTATSEAVGRKLAIVVDDRIVVDPVIRAPIASVQGEISGGFTKASAAELIDLMQNGRLDARVTVVSRTPAPCAAR
jgi:preprotein translocase subunit SecD